MTSERNELERKSAWRESVALMRCAIAYAVVIAADSAPLRKTFEDIGHRLRAVAELRRFEYPRDP